MSERKSDVDAKELAALDVIRGIIFVPLVIHLHRGLRNGSNDCLSERFGVGQNLYIYKQTRKSAATDWTRSVTDWYDEVTLFSNKRVKPFRKVMCTSLTK